MTQATISRIIPEAKFFFEGEKKFFVKGVTYGPFKPDALFSYATYPPTEYLLPQNSDFSCFNVYLHNQRDFEGYLLRLQNLTGEHPLILGEFGMDTIRHSQDQQAEMLGWHIDSVVKCGLAGTILFTWTDEWFTGG